jgi:hypothetical protein
LVVASLRQASFRLGFDVNLEKLIFAISVFVNRIIRNPHGLGGPISE